MKHGLTQTRLYRIWGQMRARCYTKSSINFQYYGDRGITVCSEWDNFNDFYSWAINSGYEDSLSLDRIDVNGNYCPENCRWITPEEQQHNKRSNHLITHEGETKTLTQWARTINIKPQTLSKRLRSGMSFETAIKTPVKPRNTITVSNKITAARFIEALKDSGMKQRVLAQKIGVNESTISHYVNGRFLPSIETANAIGAILNVQPAWLMGFDVPKEK